MTAEAARVWAEELCSRAEYAGGEIRERLIRKGLAPNVADRIVDALVETRFIDDRRFARAFVRDKVRYSHWGKRKVMLALYQKRVDRDIIDDALSEIDEEEYIGGLATLLRSKLRSIGDGDDTLSYETKTKLYRFAASRGFESSAISRAIDTII